MVILLVMILDQDKMLAVQIDISLMEMFKTMEIIVELIFSLYLILVHESLNYINT